MAQHPWFHFTRNVQIKHGADEITRCLHVTGMFLQKRGHVRAPAASGLNVRLNCNVHGVCHEYNKHLACKVTRAGTHEVCLSELSLNATDRRHKSVAARHIVYFIFTFTMVSFQELLLKTCPFIRFSSPLPGFCAMKVNVSLPEHPTAPFLQSADCS